jgi:hypothetical protein
MGNVLGGVFGNFANEMTVLGPMLVELAKLLLNVVQAVLPFSQSLMQMVALALVPVNRILQFLGTILTGLMPLFKALGLVFYGLTPLIMMVSFVVDQVVKGFEMLFGWLGSFPMINAIFKSFGPGIDKLTGQFKGLTDVTDKTTASQNKLTQVLSKRLPKVNIDAGTSGKTDTATVLENAASSIASSVKEIVSSLKSLGQTKKSMGDFEKEVTDIFDKVDATLGSSLKNGFLGRRGVETLKSFANKEKKILLDVAMQRDLLSRQIAKATEVQSALMDSANITNALDATSNSIVESIVYLDRQFKVVASGVSNTSNDLVGAFRKNLEKIRTFYKNLDALSKSNLDAGLIDQIASAGVDAGNATAEQIISSGQTGIDALNQIYKDIKVTAGNAGAVVGSSMTQAGQDIGNGLIDGLKATETQLADLASTLAATFADKFKSAMQSGLASMQAFQSTQEKLILAPKGTSVWGPVGKSKIYGDKPQFVYKGTEASKGGGMQGILPALGQPNSNVDQNVPVASIRNPYRFDNPYYQTFQDNALLAAQYNIVIKVDPTANAAQVGEAMVNAIKAYERSAGTRWRKNP